MSFRQGGVSLSVLLFVDDLVQFLHGTGVSAVELIKGALAAVHPATWATRLLTKIFVFINFFTLLL